MPRANAQTIAAMDAAQAETERALSAAEERVWLISALPDFALTSLQKTSRDSVRGARKRFNQWSSELRRWAIEGMTDDGRRYTPEEWRDFGQELAEAMAKEAQLVLTTGAFNLYTPLGAVMAPLTSAAAQTGARTEVKVREVGAKVAETLAGLDPRKPWSFKTKALVAGGATLLTLGVVAWFASSVTPLLEMVKPDRKEGSE